MASYLECLLLEECQGVCKDIQSFYSLPIGCMEIGLNRQVLDAEESKCMNVVKFEVPDFTSATKISCQRVSFCYCELKEI